MLVTCYRIWTGGPEYAEWRNDQPKFVFIAKAKDKPGVEIERVYGFDIEEGYVLEFVTDKKGRIQYLTGDKSEPRYRKLRGWVTVIRNSDIELQGDDEAEWP